MNKDQLASVVAAEVGLSQSDAKKAVEAVFDGCLLYTSPSPRDVEESRMPSSA